MTVGDVRAPPCAPPDLTPRTPRLRLDARACDCHAHVIGPARHYPFAIDRVYTPPDCLPAAYDRMREVVGLERAVLVQPSVYGNDNRLLLDALRRDPERLRGVAVIEPDASDEALASMHSAGVRGIRLNLVDTHAARASLPMSLLRRLAGRVAGLGWHLELLLHVDQHAEQSHELTSLGVPVVVAHFGYQSVGHGPEHRGFQALLDSMRSEMVWVKLTGPYRLTREEFPYEACLPLAKALREAAPHRLLWGSDWPHVMLKGRMPNDAELVDLIEPWVPDAAMRRLIMVTNPAQLYGFPA
jgi:2-pyrone-4,6-dicarboxylate lactonase